MIKGKKVLIKSVQKALDILEYIIINGEQGMSISKLSGELKFPQSSIHHLVSTLVRRGYLTKETSSHLYYVGPRMIEMSGVCLSRLYIRNIARPFLEELWRECNETIHLAILLNDEAVDIDTIESSQTIRMVTQIGKRMPLYCSAVGKVLLAYLPENDFEYIIRVITLHRYTENTITTLDGLKKELLRIKKDGAAYNLEEYEKGVRCVAAPIRDHQAKVIGGVSISCPAVRFPAERKIALTQLVKTTVEKISAELGYIKK